MQNSDWFLATKLLSGEHIINEKSTIVQVVTWCSQATAITWPNVDPNVNSENFRHMASLDMDFSDTFWISLNKKVNQRP